MKIDYSAIFHVADDGIYHTDGVIFYSRLIADENGFHGEQIYQNGEFRVILYSTEEICVSFPASSFGLGENALKNARVKSCSFTLFLKGKGVNVKTEQF